MTQTEKERPGQGAPSQNSLASSVPGNTGSGPYSRSAESYFRKAWYPLPVKGKKDFLPPGFTGGSNKTPGLDQIQEWVKRRGFSNVVVRAIGWIGIDVDHYGDKVGAETLAAAEAELGPLPPTWTSTSRGEGQAARIHFYRVPIGLDVAKAEKRFVDRFGPDIEIIHKRHRYAVVAPSIHPDTKAEYRWYTPEGVWGEKACPDRTKLPMLPEAWQDFLQAPQAASADGNDFWDAAEDVPAGWTRGRALAEVDRRLEKIRAVDSNINTQAGGLMVGVGRFVPGLLTQDEAERLCRDALLANPHHSDEWNLDNGKEWTASTLAGMKVANGMAEAHDVREDDSEEPLLKYTDAVMAERLVREALSGRYLYTPGMGWLRWDGKRWAETPDEVIYEDVRKWTIAGYVKAVDTWKAAIATGATDKPIHEDPDVMGWGSTQKWSRISNVTTLARGMLLTEDAKFDAVEHLLNTPSGVVNLRTGEVEPHHPSQLNTKMTSAAYVPGAESRYLKAALGALPDDVPDWLQVRMGEAVTGVSGDQMVLLTGEGSNGKTVLMGSAFRALGGYASAIPNTLLLKGRQLGGATPEKMTLRGVRLAYMEETPEEGYLDSQVLKEILDAEVISGRQLYKASVTWTPTHSLFLNTNHAPIVTDTAHASWRRLRRVDFPYTFVGPNDELTTPEHRLGDPSIKRELAHGQSGQEALLAWMVAGAARYYAAGSLEAAEDTPGSVLASVQAWRRDSDPLLRFIEEHTVPDRDALVAGSDLYAEFSTWLETTEGHHKGWSKSTFEKRLASHSGLPGYVTAVQFSKTRPELSRPNASEWIGQELVARPRGWSGLRFKTPSEQG